MFPPIYFILRQFVVDIKNAQLFSYVASSFLFLSKSVYPAIGLKNLISAASIYLLSDRFKDQFSLPYITTEL